MSNLQLLAMVCHEIEPILEQTVLVGGCATELLLTDKAAPEVRYTIDVDMLIEVISLVEYYQACDQLKNLGFYENQEVICRWEKNGLILDLMPTDEKILGFGNPWYKDTIKYKTSTVLDGMRVYHISAPYFIGTKLEAFATRGNNDFWSSHDLEDIISVIDGRSELQTEIYDTTPELRKFIQDKLSQLINDEQFIEALPGYLSPDSASQKRLKPLKEKISKLAFPEV
ncbi:MAG: hypothetical protein KZQ83_07345 [gamma proteobacterium symbiont of Taylorina sp.]|nr:hypothetical protein [gamma proteobacterium symbiont of Taylorina sp.]